MPNVMAAKALSIIGHPAVLVPAAVVISATQKNAPANTVVVALSAAVAVAVIVMTYSFVQVKAGRWSHVDASIPHERRQLNPFLIILLLAAAGACIATSQDRQIVLGLVMSAALVLLTHLLRASLKASLHVGFAVFAGFLVWPNTVATGALLVLAAAISWSRLLLQRHSRREVIAGALLGAIAGAGYLFAVARAVEVIE